MKLKRITAMITAAVMALCTLPAYAESITPEEGETYILTNSSDAEVSLSMGASGFLDSSVYRYPLYVIYDSSGNPVDMQAYSPYGCTV